MSANFKYTFNADSYVESVAYFKANKAFRSGGQSRADYIYNMMMNNGMTLWHDLTARMSWYEAEKWLRLEFGFEDTFDRPKPSANRVAKQDFKPGAECWADYTINEYKDILKKLSDSLHGNKSGSNAERQLKNAVNNAWLFVQVKPGIYNVERHGKWISESEFSSMLESCKEIISKYEVVSTIQTAA